jgi:hypothetical protein
MSDERKEGPATSAAAGWASHAGHLNPEDFSAESPAVEEGTGTPEAAQQVWNTLPPGTYPPSGLDGGAAGKPGRSAMLPWVVIGALLVLVLILVGALNLRDYHLIQDGDRVEVRRGGWLPATTRGIDADSPLLSRRYAPLKLELGMQFRSRRFTEREDLDSGLIDLLVELLAPAVRRGDDDRVEHLGARLELFPTAGVVLEGRHQELLRQVGLVRGKRAEADALAAVLRARDLYRRYHKHAGPELSHSLERLGAVERMLSTKQTLPKSPRKSLPKAAVGSEF